MLSPSSARICSAASSPMPGIWSISSTAARNLPAVRAFTSSSKVAKFPLLAVGHKTCLEQPMLMELGQPLGILDVGLAAGDRLCIAGIDQREFETPCFEHIPGRLPVNSGALHRHLFHAQTLQPFGQPNQICVVGCKATDLASIGRDGTPDQHLLVHVQRRAPLANLPQHAAPPSSSGSCEAVLSESEFRLRAHLQAGAQTCHGACS